PGPSARDMVEVLPRASTTVDPFYNPGAPINVVILWEIHGDLQQGYGVNATVDHLRQYVTARHAVGWKVLIMTSIPEPPGTLTPDGQRFEFQRLAVNAKVRAGETGADGVLDVASAPAFLHTDADISQTECAPTLSRPDTVTDAPPVACGPLFF